MTRKTQTKSTDAPTAAVNDDWKQRLVADAEKTEYFLSHITADAECFLSRICTAFQKFENGEVRVLKQEPVISARLGKLSADDVKKIYRYLDSGVGDFSYISCSPSQNYNVVGSVVVSYEKDEIISERENYIIREVSNLFIHSADEIDDCERISAIVGFEDEANPNFAHDRGILRKCVAFASKLATTPAASTPVTATASKPKRATNGKTAWCVEQRHSVYSNSKTPWANIRDDWNKLPEEKRKAIDPKDNHTFSTGKSGRDQVSKRCNRNS